MGETLLKSKGNLATGMARQASGQLQFQQNQGHQRGRKPALAKDFVDGDRGRAQQGQNYFAARVQTGRVGV